MGADFVMVGRYFARFDESPTKIVKIGNNYLKEYWGEGSDRAKNWQRYDLGLTTNKLSFEEGVNAYIPYAGSLKDNLEVTLYKIRSTLCNCGATDIKTLHQNARLTLVSEVSIKEGSAHDVTLREIDKTYK
jgi:IMP dehydrogenase